MKLRRLKGKVQLKDVDENPNIDFSRVMANKEAYFELDQIQLILDYFYEQSRYMEFMLFFVLYRTGRRISEILGKPPYTPDKKMCLSHYKGLRPRDIYDKERAIEFDIMKKNPIKRKTLKGAVKSKDKIKRMRMKKKPKRVLIAIDQELYDYLKWYIEYNNIQRMERLFPISRFTANLLLKEAVKETGIKINLGERKVRLRNSGFVVEVPKQPHLHMFRHSFAIHILKKNQDNPAALPMLTHLLQHSTSEMTRSYLQFTQKDARNFLDKTFVDEK